MLVFCISSLNIKHAKENSTSLKICKEVKSVKKAENSIFPKQEYDWDDIRKRILPLVQNVIKEI